MSEGGPPALIMAALTAAREALVAQCPVPALLSPVERAARPVHVATLGEGPPILFIHGGVQGGLGGGPTSFVGQHALANRWQLRLVDRPGFGPSPTHGPDDMEADAEWIAELCSEGVHLVGHSWGGAESLLAAARRPGAIKSLTLIEPALMPLIQVDPAARSDPRTMTVGAQMGGMMMRSTTPADYAVAFAATLVAAGQPNERVAALEADPAFATASGCAMLQARMAPPSAMAAAAAAIKTAGVPVLTVSGGWSVVFDFTSEVAARLCGGRHCVVAARDHFVQQSSASAFNTVFHEFLRGAA